MKELVFNLFYFANAGIIEELGAATHEADGSDEQKLTLLQSLVDTDYKLLNQRFIFSAWSR